MLVKVGPDSVNHARITVHKETHTEQSRNQSHLACWDGDMADICRQIVKMHFFQCSSKLHRHILLGASLGNASIASGSVMYASPVFRELISNNNVLLSRNSWHVEVMVLSLFLSFPLCPCLLSFPRPISPNIPTLLRHVWQYPNCLNRIQ